MIGVVLMLSGLVLLSGAIGWFLSRRPAASRDPQPVFSPVSAPVAGGQDVHAESGAGEYENGLAAFYSYQMAVARIDRVG
ncbi:MAG: hypothetical protein E4H01_02525 [Lysobacterales bacterium]|nr:MAG: hypothetical protein E4H01_02525 [Xanthomonadales bacterium]